MSLTSEIRDYAKSCGAVLFGVTSADPFPRYLARVTDLEKAGNIQALKTSKYINSAMADPRNVLRSARSIIVVGVPWMLRTPRDSSLQYQGPYIFLSRYWRHARRVHVNLGRLIAEYLQKRGIESREAGHRSIPLKPAAVRAGLANYGKNTIVYNKDLGSWVWWFAILTEAELEITDAAGEDICGDCDKCIKACPTAAIHEPYRLDFLRCRVYLSHPPLQDVGEIPDSLKEKMGNCLCGCEICQHVCPLNRNVEPVQTEATFDYTFYDVPLPDQERLPLSELLQLLQGPCDHYFKRYASICIGNLKGADAALPLLMQMNDPKDELVREYAHWAIERIKQQGKSAI